MATQKEDNCRAVRIVLSLRLETSNKGEEHDHHLASGKTGASRPTGSIEF